MDTTQILNNIKKNANILVANINNNFTGPWDNNFVGTICTNINELSYEVRNKNIELYEDLQNIKANLFFGQNIVNTFTLGRLIQIMRSYNYLSTNDIWQFIHPKIIDISKSKFVFPLKPLSKRSINCSLPFGSISFNSVSNIL